MSVKKTTLKGSTITCTANNGAATAITMQCEKLDLTIPNGNYEILQDLCHNTGVVYSKSQTPTFATMDLEIWLTGDKTDAERLFWNDAHNNLNDFTQQNGDQTLTVQIALADVDANVISFSALCSNVDMSLLIKKDNVVKITLQPTTSPAFA